MSEEHLPAERPPELPVAAGRGEPELRLEFSNAGVRRVWALYSEDEGAAASEPLPPPAPEDPLSFLLRDLPALAWRRRKHLAIGLGAGLGFGLLYLSVATYVYHVGANVLIERRASPLDEGDRLRGWSLATQAEILQSPSIVRDAVESLAERGLVRPGAEAAGEAAPGEATLPIVAATPITGTNVVVISYRTPDPAWGTAFVAALIESYGAYARSIERTTPERALELVRRKEKEIREELTARESEYQKLRGASQSFGEGSEALTVQKAVLERHAQMLVDARTHRFDLENRLAAARASSRGGARPVPEAAARLQEELWRAELRLAQASDRFSDEHPEVVSARNEVETLKRQLAASRLADVAALEREVAAARETERRLEEAYEREVRKGIALDAHRLREEELLEKIRSLRSVHELALEKLKTLELHYEAASEGDGGVIVRVLDGPAASTGPVWPQPVLVLLPCAFVGLLGGLGLALLSERLAPARRAPAEGRALAPATRVLYPRRVREGA
jgi:uncharacterized protein involved in exopolysaccharide biosynthesis